jgi:transcription antitermination factor NusG
MKEEIGTLSIPMPGMRMLLPEILRQRIESLGMQNKIFNVVVPTEKKIKVKGGKRVEEEEKSISRLHSR